MDQEQDVNWEDDNDYSQGDIDCGLSFDSQEADVTAEVSREFTVESDGSAHEEVSEYEEATAESDQVEQFLTEVDELTDSIFEMTLQLHKQIKVSVDLALEHANVMKMAAALVKEKDARTIVAELTDQLEPLKANLANQSQTMTDQLAKAKQAERDVLEATRDEQNTESLNDAAPNEHDAPSPTTVIVIDQPSVGDEQ